MNETVIKETHELAVSKKEDRSAVPRQCHYWLRDGRLCSRKIRNTYCSQHEGKRIYPKCRGAGCIGTTRSANGYCTRCEDGCRAHKIDFKHAIRDARIRQQRKNAVEEAR